MTDKKSDKPTGHLLIVGAGGGLGQALVKHYLEAGWQVTAYSRQSAPLKSEQLDWQQIDDYAALREVLPDTDAVDGVISTIGMLHNDDFMPEKHLGAVNATQLEHSFKINAILPMLVLQQVLDKLPKKSSAFFVQLSAKVGSITDNYLGGWYSYRASKAALNMLLKTASIELGRSHKKLVIAAIHPGTTDTQLSEPFQERVADDKLYSPMQSAERIAEVIANLTTEHSGKLLHWDGSELPY
ncbi:SDR family NAD(P)-dependent oxidoreductase [Pseudidiomarina insulisalsae]|uniref:Short-chain dehydrogenase n=1 Tax=Pseudidiomarina insulisalsae TaxID=575789 RepID=A0A432YQZ4_9GAMM|nr:SDR family NAD(P)-dependent oxidoreductase [Pseudidiomarina insulisalsae]RUO63702.1 short-chain dehydrogenase [Pseudidiomarina insulisalsae]